MVRVSSVPLVLGLEHQMIIVHKTIEAVSTGSGLGEQILYYKVELVCAYAGVTLTYRHHYLDYLALANGTLLANRATHTIITFAGLAKQLAQTFYRGLGMPEPKVVYCLAPTFFSKSMPYCSRPIFNTSLSASLRNSEYSNALRRRAFSSLRSSSLLDADDMRAICF